MRKLFKIPSEEIIILATGCSIAIALGILAIFFRNDSSLSNALYTLSVIFVIITAFITIWHSSTLNKRIRLWESEKENRLRKERWLDDILDWAANIMRSTLTTDISITTLSGQDLFGALLIALDNPLSKSEYIKSIASILDKNLKASVENTSSKLELCVTSCGVVLDLLAKAQQAAPAFKQFCKLKVDAEKSAKEVIKLASKLKISLLP